PAQHAFRRRPDRGGAHDGYRDAPGRRRPAARAHQRQPVRRGARAQCAGRHAPGSAVHLAGHEERRRAARRVGDHLSPAMAIPSYPSGASAIAFDVRTLDNLKGRVQQSPDAAAGHYREVAKQFEALFLQVMLKAMREATPQNGLFDSDQTRLARSLADEQLAFELASPGIGLAQALLDMIQRQQGGADQGQGTAAWHAHEANTSRVPGLRSHIGAYDGRSAPSVPPA